MSLERKVGKEFEFRVSGGSEFQSCGQMTEKALLPSDDRTYGMDRTSESEDRVETECDGNEQGRSWPGGSRGPDPPSQLQDHFLK